MLNRRSFLARTTGAVVLAPQWNTRDRETRSDVAVIGGGVGGFAAALAACRRGMQVILTEETDWLGGQLTSQAVPPDEHAWIEQFGCTRSYRTYREGVRNYYRTHYPLTEAARSKVDLNPGNGTVSRLTHEFRVSVAVLEGMLAPFEGNGQLLILREHVPVSASTVGDRVTAITLRSLRSGAEVTLTATYFIDATELGDLLPLTSTEFVTGAEAAKQTNELHASAKAEPSNSQSITYCFAVDHLAGEDHVIDRPADYAFWRDYIPALQPKWIGPLLNWTATEPKTLGPRKGHLHPNPDDGAPEEGFNLWTYRRIADRNNFVRGSYRSDIALVNWPQNDYWLADLVTAHDRDKQRVLQAAKGLSFAFLYWMQTDAPRPDGGTGFKGLRLRKDIVGTNDGMAKFPYIRESRRIQADFTVLEEHVGTEMRAAIQKRPPVEATAAVFRDSVGIGCYRIDLHPSAGGSNYIDISSLPFQIPLGALLPKRTENLLAASKNIGTTHITNGCYRLHPLEWNIGEAAGALAAFSVARRTSPKAVRKDERMLDEFQRGLSQEGMELAWPHIHPV